MKTSIRTKFTAGMIFIYIIILVLIFFSCISINLLSKKTSSILKENYVSVVYAQEMSEGLLNLNQEIINSFMEKKNPDTLLISREFQRIAKSLQLEKNNITEAGEEKLVENIDRGIEAYQKEVKALVINPEQASMVSYLQKKYLELYQQLSVLSQMNGNAIEVKTENVKNLGERTFNQMIILGSVCFLIALSFMYSFSSSFNERISQLYNGIKDIASSNFGYRLYYEGSDEFYEISLIFNAMAEKLSNSDQKKNVPLSNDWEYDESKDDYQELKNILTQIKNIQVRAEDIISRLDHNG